MTRTEYLTQLELYLKKLPQADQIEAMDYFRELFDDAGVEGEEELIASLGTPKEAAHEVLSNLLDKKINEAPAFCPVCQRALERLINFYTEK